MAKHPLSKWAGWRVPLAVARAQPQGRCVDDTLRCAGLLTRAVGGVAPCGMDG